MLTCDWVREPRDARRPDLDLRTSPHSYWGYDKYPASRVSTTATIQPRFLPAPVGS